MHAVRDSLLLKFMGEEVMAVHIELQPERRPCGDTHVTQAKLFVKEVKVIMETLALVKSEEGLSRSLVLPCFVSIALFHGGKDMDQPFGLSCFSDDLLDPVIFAEGSELADKPNINAIFIRNALGI